LHDCLAFAATYRAGSTRTDFLQQRREDDRAALRHRDRRD
jgi:hypothetical protein